MLSQHLNHLRVEVSSRPTVEPQPLIVIIVGVQFGPIVEREIIKHLS